MDQHNGISPDTSGPDAQQVCWDLGLDLTLNLHLALCLALY